MNHAQLVERGTVNPEAIGSIPIARVVLFSKSRDLPDYFLFAKSRPAGFSLRRK